MIRRARTWLSATLDDPWRVLQVYLVLLAVFVLAAGLALSADPARPPAGDRPVVQGVSR